MTREQLEDREQSLILRYLELDERGTADEVEAVREELVAVQVMLMAKEDDHA